jgi:hypothetical protein
MALNQQGSGITAQEIHFQQNPTEIEKREIHINNPGTEQRTITYQINNNRLDKEIRQFDSESYQYDRTPNRLKNIESGIVRKKQNTPKYDEPPVPDQHGFVNVDISWNTWKSNFINRVLDDSMTIQSINDYKIGTWFYYSFEVTNTGEIQNIKVTSFSLKKEDKAEVIKLIQSYAHKDITVFPRNSKRKKAKVDAIMLLGETESKSSPSDFNDLERVRLHY